MKSYNLFDKVGFVKLEDEKKYVTFKSVIPTKDTELYKNYPYTIQAIEDVNGKEGNVYFLGDEKAMDALVKGEGLVPFKIMHKYNAAEGVKVSVYSCKLRLA